MILQKRDYYGQTALWAAKTALRPPLQLAKSIRRKLTLKREESPCQYSHNLAK